MIQLLLNKTTPPFQLLPMPKVDQSELRIHEAPPLQKAKSQVIPIIFNKRLVDLRTSGQTMLTCISKDSLFSWYRKSLV